MELYYKELLHQWKIDEDNIKDELKEIGVGVKEISSDVKEIGASVKELTKKLDNLKRHQLRILSGKQVMEVRDLLTTTSSPPCLVK